MSTTSVNAPGAPYAEALSDEVIPTSLFRVGYAGLQSELERFGASVLQHAEFVAAVGNPDCWEGDGDLSPADRAEVGAEIAGGLEWLTEQLSDLRSTADYLRGVFFGQCPGWESLKDAEVLARWDAEAED